MSESVRERFPPGKSPFRVKGVTYRNFLDFVGEVVPGGREALISSLHDEPLRQFAAQQFLSGTFYDTLPIVPLCQAAAVLQGKPFDAMVKDLSQFAAERDTKGIYRMLLRLVSPDMVMERTPAAARQYFDFVTATVTKVAPKSYRTTAKGIPQFIGQFYMLVTTAFLERALTLAGARDVSTRWISPTPDGLREGIAIVNLGARSSGVSGRLPARSLFA